MTLHGFVSRPDRHRATAAGCFLFVNNRPVRDRVLQNALVGVYRDILPRGRFPTAVLFLDLPPTAVDVNVHPAKWEVRFADPQSVHRLVRHAVRDAVSERSWIAPEIPDAPEPVSFVREAADLASAPRAEPASANSQPGASTYDRGTTDWIFARSEATAAESRLRFADLRLLGQFLATYLLLESKDRLLLVDQHAAHERVLYERFRAEWVERGVESQGLLAVEVVRLAPRSHAALLTARDSLQRFGFEIDAFGEGTVAVRAVPALLGDSDPAALVRNLADELESAGSDALRIESRALDAADRIFASLACHGARRKGDLLGPSEQQALLDALDAIPWAPTCPHGRPVAVPFEVAEIERRFGRR